MPERSAEPARERGGSGALIGIENNSAEHVAVCAVASGGRRGYEGRHVADQPRRRCALICGLNFGTYSASVPLCSA